MNCYLDEALANYNLIFFMQKNGNSRKKCIFPLVFSLLFDNHLFFKAKTINRYI